MKKKMLFTIPVSILLIAVIVTSFFLINIKPDASGISNAKKLAEYSKPAVARVVDTLTVTWKFYGGDSDVLAYLQKSGYQTDVAWWGSGAVISEDGYVVTNAHVVTQSTVDENQEQEAVKNALSKVTTGISETYGYAEQDVADYLSEYLYYSKVTSKIDVIMPGGDSYNATVKSYGDYNNTGKDVAVLKLEGAKNLPSLPLGNSDNIQNQDNIWAIGYPGSADTSFEQKSIMDSSMTGGQITAASKTTEQESPIIQINAVAAPGSSGGPVINEKGQIIGLTTAGSTETQGINFAVPVNAIKEFVNQAGVRNTVSETNTLFKEGLTLYWAGYYKDALEKFESLQRIYPKHSRVEEFITDSQEKINQSKVLWSNYKTAFYIGDGVSGVLIVLLMVYTFVLKPKQPDSPVTVGEGENATPEANHPDVVHIKDRSKKTG